MPFQDDRVSDGLLAQLTSNLADFLLSVLLDPVSHALLVDELDASCAFTGRNQHIPFDVAFQADSALPVFHCHFLFGIDNVGVLDGRHFLRNHVRLTGPLH